MALARLYSIEGRQKTHEMEYSTPGDFVLGAPAIAPAAIILNEPGWSPYCIDHTNHELVCVHLADSIDLAKSAFYYLTQYQRADRMLTLPLTALADLAGDLPDPNVVIIYSMGRCGTTLASLALNESPQAWSLSEPEVFNDRSLRLPPDAPVAGGDLVRLLIRIIFAQRARREATTLALKLRSQATFHMQQFIDARPDARAVFMYRDALGWGQSMYQFLGEFDWQDDIPADQRLPYWDFFSGGGPLSQLERYVETPSAATLTTMIGAGWLHCLETYLDRLAGGVQFLALRYNDLTLGRRHEIEKLFRHAGLDTSGLDGLDAVFDEDSQKGLSIGQREGKRRLSEAQISELRAVLDAHPRLRDPNLVLPDIYSR
ncbi:MAG: hypothetical protein EOP22_08680 [Hyphomicrobiales bacterium]|nr:MAG: hypothetical protein EOP22_08680 [Hyphomicrobiales bacterium]